MSRRSLSERPGGSASTLLVAVYPGPGMHLDVSWSNQVSVIYRCRWSGPIRGGSMVPPLIKIQDGEKIEDSRCLKESVKRKKEKEKKRTGEDKVRRGHMPAPASPASPHHSLTLPSSPSFRFSLPPSTFSASLHRHHGCRHHFHYPRSSIWPFAPLSQVPRFPQIPLQQAYSRVCCGTLTQNHANAS
jgi:hypothetical protein